MDNREPLTPSHHTHKQIYSGVLESEGYCKVMGQAKQIKTIRCMTDLIYERGLLGGYEERGEGGKGKQDIMGRTRGGCPDRKRNQESKRREDQE